MTQPSTAPTPASRDPLLLGACALGCIAAALALVPSETYAEAFAHPARVVRLDGAIPDATLRGALAFRMALAVGALAIPTLAWLLTRLCAAAHAGKGAKRARGASPASDGDGFDRLPSTPRTRRGWITLGAIIAGGALLRVLIARESLWYDEISSLISFALEGPGVAFGSYAVPTNHVPMTLAVWLSVSAFGSVAELAVRLPALLAGIATVPVAYALGAALRDSRLGNALALVAACAPIAILESAEARGYAFVILGAALAALALVRAERTGARGDYVLFAGATAFAAWAHPVAILLPFAAGIVGLLRDRRLAASALLAGVLAAVLLSPLVGDVLATRDDYLRTDVAQPSVFSREGYETLAGLALSWSRWWMTPAPALTALALVGVAIVARARATDSSRARRALAPFALALALALALPPLLGSWTYARFTLFALPIGFVAIGLAIDRLPGRVAASAVLALLAADALASLDFYRTKQPIRDAVSIVAGLRTPGGAVATIGLPDNAVGFYARQLGFEAIATGFLGRDLEAVVAREAPEFVVALYPERLAPSVIATLDAGFDRTHRLEGWADWGHGAVEIWRRSPR